MLTVGRDGVVTTRWSKGHPIHIARSNSNSGRPVALCGIKLRTVDWIERKKGSFVDEDELCPRCKGQGAVAELTKGGMLARLHLPEFLGRRKGGTPGN